MRLNKQTAHAIAILIECAKSGRLLKVADAARASGVTPQNAFKISHLLVRAGFLEAERGRNGGIRLSRPARDIRIGEVVRAMEASLSASGEADPGAISRVFDQALDAFVAVLDQHTLDDMASGATRLAGSKAPSAKRRTLPAAHASDKR